MKKKLLTVFTPTYNRVKYLEVCYKSLVRQTCKDFVWLIIDDGSTDGTGEVVSTWIVEGVIEIRYHWQRNKGMHGAHNTAYELIDTELNVCIDSDDFMPEDGVRKIIEKWRNDGSDKVSGMIGLDAYRNGEIIGTKLPTNLKTSTLFNLYYKHGVSGDKKVVYRTELTKQYKYPEFENEKYVGLAYKYYKLDEQFEMLLMNEVVCIVEYLAEGSSMNMLNQYRRNPRGFAFYRKELMKLPFASRAFRFRQAIHYVSSSLLSRNFKFFQETRFKSYTILAFPLGLILFIYISSKTTRP